MTHMGYGEEIDAANSASIPSRASCSRRCIGRRSQRIGANSQGRLDIVKLTQGACLIYAVAFDPSRDEPPGM